MSSDIRSNIEYPHGPDGPDGQADKTDQTDRTYHNRPASLQHIFAPTTTDPYSYSRCLLDHWSLTSLTVTRPLKFPTAQKATTPNCPWPSSPLSQSHRSSASATSTNDVPDSFSAALTKRRRNAHDSGKLQETNRLPAAFRQWAARGI